jgi:hypothetical protein
MTMNRLAGAFTKDPYSAHRICHPDRNSPASPHQQ